MAGLIFGICIPVEMDGFRHVMQIENEMIT